MHETRTDVCVLGAGWSGIVACKHMLQEGLDVVVLESDDAPGGVWRYREGGPERGQVMKSTRTTSSRTVTEMSDFAMPDAFSHFPRHDEIYEYLRLYRERFDLDRQIRLRSEAASVRRDDDHWVVEDQSGNRVVSRFLVVSTGVHQFPNRHYLTDPRFDGFSGDMIHSASYRKLTDEYEDTRILIYGGGETASDIAVEVSHAAREVHLSIPNGQWFVNRFLNYGSMYDPVPLDYFSSRLRRFFDPTTTPRFGEYIVREQGFCGHGIEAWRSPAPYWGQFFNKNAEVLRSVSLGTVKPKPDVTHCDGSRIHFVDGSNAEIDRIIFCTGYETRFPFFDDPNYQRPINRHFKLVFPIDDPRVAFVGFARPVVGLIPALAELQCMLASKVFAGTTTLPSAAERAAAVERDAERRDHDYAQTSKRITGLVNFVLYADDLAGLAGLKPDYLQLFRNSPSKWFAAVAAPYNNCQFLLNAPSHHDEIFRRYRKYTHRVLRRWSNYSLVLAVNLFPGPFLRDTPVSKSRWLTNLALLPIWIALSPVLVLRLFRNPER